MKEDILNISKLSEEELATIQGGGQNGANIFLTGVGGAVEGVGLCLANVPFPTPQIYAMCALGDAAVAIIWPH